MHFLGNGTFVFPGTRRKRNADFWFQSNLDFATTNLDLACFAHRRHVEYVLATEVADFDF